VTSTLLFSPLLLGAQGLDADLVLECNVSYILFETSVIILSCTCVASFRGNVDLVLWCRVLIFCFAVLSVGEVGGVGYICVLLVHRYVPH
jgi:nitrate reductase NapE component